MSQSTRESGINPKQKLREESAVDRREAPRNPLKFASLLVAEEADLRCHLPRFRCVFPRAESGLQNSRFILQKERRLTRPRPNIESVKWPENMFSIHGKGGVDLPPTNDELDVRLRRVEEAILEISLVAKYAKYGLLILGLSLGIDVNGMV